MRSVERQRGAVALTVAFALLFLLGFMALALDFGHMFVVKDELQTSLDACALSAAQELDGASDALTRATNAGMTAGNLNNVNFQSGTWSGQGKIVATDITFKDASYGTTTVPANAKYAQCQHSQNGIQMWLFQAMGAFAGSSDPAYSSTKNVGALAVATRANAQTTCPFPTALVPKPGGTAPNYGFQVGEWVTVVAKGAAGPGEMGWYNLDGSTSASELKAEISGSHCGMKPGDTLGTPGMKMGAEDAMNARFGIYKNGDPGPSVNPPDFSGYAYTSTNWTNAVPQNAYAGTPAPGSDPTAANFKTKRLAFANYDDTGGTNKQAVKNGDKITGLTIQGGYTTLASHGAGGQHEQYGSNRRITAVPVIDSGNRITDWVCVFLLQPLPDPNTDIQVEFLGNASDPNSQCTSNGLAGGAGPLTPVLVQ